MLVVQQTDAAELLQAAGGTRSIIAPSKFAKRRQRQAAAIIEVVHKTRTSLSSAGCCPCPGPWPGLSVRQTSENLCARQGLLNALARLLGVTMFASMASLVE